MTSSRVLLSFVTVALTVSCGGGGGSSGPTPGGSGGSGGGSTEVTKDFTVTPTGLSVSRPSNSDAVEVDMSSIAQSGSVTVTQ